MQFISVRKTLEANMHMTDLFPPGRVLWAIRDGDLHPAHRLPTPVPTRESTRHGKSVAPAASSPEKDKLRLFEVLDVEKVFSQIVFAKDMLRYVFCYLPPRFCSWRSPAVPICHINTTESCMSFYKFDFGLFALDWIHFHDTV